jgi:hypothetical protein
MTSDTHTSISHLLTSNDDGPSAIASPSSPPNSVSSQSISHGKEREPFRVSVIESTPTQEDSVEKSPENSSEKSDGVSKEKRIKIKDPTQVSISDDAAKAGLTVAPTASFPDTSVYDIKLPVLTDEEIVQDLKKNPLTGARWLAELGKYILWKAHIQLRTIGGKVVRMRTGDDASIATKLKRFFWY